MNKVYTLQFTPEADEDIERLFDFILKRDETDFLLAEEALDKIKSYLFQQLAYFPYNFRKVESNNPYIREIIIPFGGSGYVARYEIEPDDMISIVAIRHQLEEDYH